MELIEHPLVLILPLFIPNEILVALDFVNQLHLVRLQVDLLLDLLDLGVEKIEVKFLAKDVFLQ